MQSCHPSNLVFNPVTRVCTWSTDPAVKDRCNVTPTQTPPFPSSYQRPTTSNKFINEGKNQVLKPQEDDLCPSDYSGLSPYPYDCKKFVNCWKGT